MGTGWLALASGCEEMSFRISMLVRHGPARSSGCLPTGCASCRYLGISWRYHGPWLAFFAVQGPLCLLEAALKPGLQQRGLLPPTWLAVPATTGCVLWIFSHMPYSLCPGFASGKPGSCHSRAAWGLHLAPC